MSGERSSVITRSNQASNRRTHVCSINASPVYSSMSSRAAAMNAVMSASRDELVMSQNDLASASERGSLAGPVSLVRTGSNYLPFLTGVTAAFSGAGAASAVFTEGRAFAVDSASVARRARPVWQRCTASTSETSSVAPAQNRSPAWNKCSMTTSLFMSIRPSAHPSWRRRTRGEARRRRSTNLRQAYACRPWHWRCRGSAPARFRTRTQWHNR